MDENIDPRATEIPEMNDETQQEEINSIHNGYYDPQSVGGIQSSGDRIGMILLPGHPGSPALPDTITTEEDLDEQLELYKPEDNQLAGSAYKYGMQLMGWIMTSIVGVVFVIFTIGGIIAMFGGEEEVMTLAFWIAALTPMVAIGKLFAVGGTILAITTGLSLTYILVISLFYVIGAIWAGISAGIKYSPLIEVDGIARYLGRIGIAGMRSWEYVMFDVSGGFVEMLKDKIPF